MGKNGKNTVYKHIECTKEIYRGVGEGNGVRVGAGYPENRGRLLIGGLSASDQIPVGGQRTSPA
jgi:hypothetical protein